MSYCLTPYFVDIADIKSTVGCRDAGVLNAIKALDPEKYEDETDDEDEIPLGRALQQLVMGEPRETYSTHQYGYALAKICAFRGEVEWPDLWGGVRWEAIEACGLEPLLTKTGPPVELPTIPDFPTIGHLRRQDIPAQLVTTRKRKEQIRDDELTEMLDEFIGWLELAQAKNKDVVFFYY